MQMSISQSFSIFEIMILVGSLIYVSVCVCFLSLSFSLVFAFCFFFLLPFQNGLLAWVVLLHYSVNPLHLCMQLILCLLSVRVTRIV